MSLDPSPNPYAAPQTPLSPSTADSRSWFGRIVGEWQRGAWPLVFMLNLLLPGTLGFLICTNAGRGGMILTTVAVLLLTAWIVAENPLMRARLIAGGKIVWVLQLIPFFHGLFASLSISLLERFHLLRPGLQDDGFDPLGSVGFLPACLLTLLVGGQLLAFAYFIGLRRISHEEEEKIRTGFGKPSDSNF